MVKVLPYASIVDTYNWSDNVGRMRWFLHTIVASVLLHLLQLIRVSIAIW